MKVFNKNVESSDSADKKEAPKKLRRGLSFLYGGKMDDEDFNENIKQNDEKNNQENDINIKDDEEDSMDSEYSYSDANIENEEDDFSSNVNLEHEHEEDTMEVENEEKLDGEYQELSIDSDNDEDEENEVVEENDEEESEEEGDEDGEEVEEYLSNDDNEIEEDEDLTDENEVENDNEEENEDSEEDEEDDSEELESSIDDDEFEKSDGGSEIENVEKKMEKINNDLKNYLNNLKNNMHDRSSFKEAVADNNIISDVTNKEEITDNDLGNKEYISTNIELDKQEVLENNEIYEKDYVSSNGDSNGEDFSEEEEEDDDADIIDYDTQEDLDNISATEEVEEGIEEVDNKNDYDDAYNNGEVFLGLRVENVDIDLIKPNPNQPRKIFNEDELNDLKNSIIQIGLLQPIVLNKSSLNNDYNIVAGERRYRAFVAMKKRYIPAIIIDFDENKRFEASIIENTQRKNLNPIEEASAYKYLIDKYDYTQDDVANAVQKSRAHIANLLRILNLPHEVKKYIIDGNLSMGHAKLLVGLGGGALMLARQVIEKDLSIRDLEGVIKKYQTLDNTKLQVDSVRKKLLNDDIKSIEQIMSNRIESLKKEGFKVQILHGKKSGTYKATISFENRNDIDRFFDSIKDGGEKSDTKKDDKYSIRSV